MKSTGIVRNLDSLGRVVIPKELRRTMGIADGDALEVFVDGDKIILRKYQPGCCLCGEAKRGLMPLFYGKEICALCVKIINDKEAEILKEF